MKDFVDIVKTHNVWLASVARVTISLVAAFGLEFTAEQMAVMIGFVETVFGVSQAKGNVAESRVDTIVQKRVDDIMQTPPTDRHE